MNIGKHIQLLVLIVAPTCLLGLESNSGASLKKNDMPVDWIEITAQNISTKEMEAFFKQLESVYVDAFKKPVMARMQQEHPEKYQAMIQRGETIEHVLTQAWQETLENVKMTLAKGLEKIPFAIIKDTKNDIVGFSIFLPLPQEIVLTTMETMGLIKEIQWIKESMAEAHWGTEVFVQILAVRPDSQGRGLGKKLVFSILSHLPQLKKIYLETEASTTNENAQKFYEHCGFECTATYTNPNKDNEQMRLYEFNNNWIKEALSCPHSGAWTVTDKSGKTVVIEGEMISSNS